VGRKPRLGGSDWATPLARSAQPDHLANVECRMSNRECRSGAESDIPHSSFVIRKRGITSRGRGRSALASAENTAGGLGTMGERSQGQARQGNPQRFVGPRCHQQSQRGGPAGDVDRVLPSMSRELHAPSMPPRRAWRKYYLRGIPSLYFLRAGSAVLSIGEQKLAKIP